MADTLIIRADGNPEIGSGHIMRCSAVAAEAQACGCEVLFAVSDESSKALVEHRGFRSIVVGGDYRKYNVQDAIKITNLADELDSRVVLVDSYAVSEAFFSALTRWGLTCAYIDDRYDFAGGSRECPIQREVALLVDYGLGADEGAYVRAYAGSSTKLLIGPAFASVRACFRGRARGCRVDRPIERVFVTSGATNPGGALERMVDGCLQAIPNAAVDVVVGALADFDGIAFQGAAVEEIRGVDDLSPLMAVADVAVSAAGSTLYELCCMGVPTVAVPVAENQLANVRGFSKRNLGLATESIEWSQADVAGMIRTLSDNPDLKRCLSEQAASVVDGLGARRITEALFDLMPEV